VGKYPKETRNGRGERGVRKRKSGGLDILLEGLY